MLVAGGGLLCAYTKQALVLFAALLDETGGRRYLKLPHIEGTFLLHTDNNEAGSA